MSSLPIDDDDYNTSNGETKTPKRKSVQNRKLVRWNADKDQLVLLTLESVCNKMNINLPWDAVAKEIEPYLTGEAIKQHLTKVYHTRVAWGLDVPERTVTGTRKRTHEQTDTPASVVAPGKNSNLLHFTDQMRARFPAAKFENNDEAATPSKKRFLGSKAGKKAFTDDEEEAENKRVILPLKSAAPRSRRSDVSKAVVKKDEDDDTAKLNDTPVKKHQRKSATLPTNGRGRRAKAKVNYKEDLGSDVEEIEGIKREDAETFGGSFGDQRPRKVNGGRNTARFGHLCAPPKEPYAYESPYPIVAPISNDNMGQTHAHYNVMNGLNGLPNVKDDASCSTGFMPTQQNIADLLHPANGTEIITPEVPNGASWGNVTMGAHEMAMASRQYSPNMSMAMPMPNATSTLSGNAEYRNLAQQSGLGGFNNFNTSIASTPPAATTTTASATNPGMFNFGNTHGGSGTISFDFMGTTNPNLANPISFGATNNHSGANMTNPLNPNNANIGAAVSSAFVPSDPDLGIIAPNAVNNMFNGALTMSSPIHYGANYALSSHPIFGESFDTIATGNTNDEVAGSQTAEAYEPAPLTAPVQQSQQDFAAEEGGASGLGNDDIFDASSLFNFDHGIY